jgi:hypothetical protein
MIPSQGKGGHRNQSSGSFLRHTFNSQHRADESLFDILDNARESKIASNHPRESVQSVAKFYEFEFPQHRANVPNPIF